MSKAEEVLSDIERKVERGELTPIIAGPVKGRILVEIVREIKPKHVLEIGTFVGYSAILRGKLENDSQLITIEIDPYVAEIARANVRKAELSAKIKVLVGDALKIISKLEGRFDLVFIDADKRQYLDYLRLIEDKLHKGSFIIADNAECAPNYLNYVRQSGKYKSKYILTSADALEVSVKL
ncbi:MAG: class I SAM-dependent methyltransferase [Candidatus Bathyarchaeia archaeon]